MNKKNKNKNNFSKKGLRKTNKGNKSSTADKVLNF